MRESSRAPGGRAMAPGVWAIAAVIVAVVAGSRPTPPCRADEPAKPAEKQADAVTAERGAFEVVLTAKGAFEPIDYTVVEFRPESWAQPLEIVSVVPHGSRVNAGDPVVEFDTRKLDEAIADLKVDLALGDAALEAARRELPAAEALHPIELAEAERAAKVAAEDLARFIGVEKAAAEEQAQFNVRSAEERLKYSREELRQLERMYKDKDLTEDTEEMILQRNRFDVAQAEHSLKRVKEATEEALTLDIPRRDIGIRRAAEKATIALEKARLVMPLQLAQRKLALSKLEHERGQSLRRLKSLEIDRAAATVRAPRAGIVYHGRFRDGTWSTAVVAAKAIVGQAVPAGELDFTILDPDRLQFRAKVEEKDLHLLAAGLAGRVEPTGYPESEVPVTLGPFLPVPRDSTFEAVFAAAPKAGGPKLLPGMTGALKCVVARRPDAITLPSGAVFRDDDGSRHVYAIGADSKATKKTVKAGLTAGGRTEILEGLAAGDRVRATKP